MEEIYKQLAERNGWDYSIDEDGRPYFMKNGKYAIPDENTSLEDKELLASIISEGSEEMAKLILLCWDNNIIISGPCSGIREFHDENPYCLHFCFITSKDLIEPLSIRLKEVFPDFYHLLREQNDMIRYDIDYALRSKDRELTKDESNKIFSIMRSQLELELENNITKKH